MAKLPGWIARQGWPLLASLIAVGLLTAALAPVSQFYLAFIALAPLLVWLRDSKTRKAAFFWSWIAGTFLFTANMWWMANITIPGGIALMIYCGLYWGAAGLIVRAANLLNRSTILAVLGIPAIWVALEWLRSYLITGFAWLYIGYTQSANLPMSQIADFSAIYGVSFWLVAINVLAAQIWINRKNLGTVIPSGMVVTAMVAGIIIYGILRIEQTAAHQIPGPTVGIIQSNYPQDNTGEKGAPPTEILDFYMKQSGALLDSNPGKIDLLVWSETIISPLNGESVATLKSSAIAFPELQTLTAKYRVGLLTGSTYATGWHEVEENGERWVVADERRNSTFFFDREGHMDDSLGKRYDKIHLVPWGEYIPFKNTIPFLYNLSLQLGPSSYKDYILTPGADDAVTVFELSQSAAEPPSTEPSGTERSGQSAHYWRFVTPICFEDIDSRLCAAMFRPENDRLKRADFLVNVTNDGWFSGSENAQHFASAVFRSIENRVPTARSVNTGISGFIDSAGRSYNLLPVRTEGTQAAQLMLDDRITFYTLYGDVFPAACSVSSIGILAWAWIRRKKPTIKESASGSA